MDRAERMERLEWALTMMMHTHDRATVRDSVVAIIGLFRQGSGLTWSDLDVVLNRMGLTDSKNDSSINGDVS